MREIVIQCGTSWMYVAAQVADLLQKWDSSATEMTFTCKIDEIAKSQTTTTLVVTSVGALLAKCYFQ